MNLKLIAWIAMMKIVFVFFSCKEDLIQVTQLGAIDQKTKNQTAFVFRPENLLMMIQTDTDLDGQTDLWTWVRGNRESPESSLVLFEEMKRKGNHSRIWYGPGNRKLIEQDDLNEDGRWESILYYNSMAIPGETLRIVGRIEVDLNGNGRPDLWIFPEARMELDRDGDGKPDHILSREILMLENFNLITQEMKIKESDFTQMKKEDSWVLRPERILNPRYQSLITISIFPTGSKQEKNHDR
ncbi:hypothetical protein JWG45_19505 [Leptospira sp. 201903070]|uniref:Lipoprotein n=1 Tax=Leptospira ainlahdjerensis TaxID=2810033 RepID=A0ABS2UHQ9_9LEPT|nr:hypothetical protein [Leptospira ainlahdjerensis]MBM9579334.1 hypothetical protein [Leptospira ainlahdjerensis]